MNTLLIEKPGGLEVLRRTDFDFHGRMSTGAELTHRMHPYPAKYIAEIPRALIRELSEPGDTVLDVFCGSGTTLVEALALGRNAIGVDANPLACLISEAKIARLSAAEVSELLDLSRAADVDAKGISDSWRSAEWRPDGDYLRFWFDDIIIEELAELLAQSRSLTTASSRMVAETAFSAIVVRVSRQDSDTRYVRRAKNQRAGDAFRLFSRALRRAVEGSEQFSAVIHQPVTGVVHHANILQSLPVPGPVDLAVCSPPYPNAYSYHLYHQSRMLWLGMDQVAFKRVEIGSHRKYGRRGQGADPVAVFVDEMRITLSRLHGSLRPAGFACFVVGDSTLRGERIENADLLSDQARRVGFGEVLRVQRRLLDTRKAFNPAIGKIKTEQVLVLQKLQPGT